MASPLNPGRDKRSPEYRRITSEGLKRRDKGALQRRKTHTSLAPQTLGRIKAETERKIEGLRKEFWLVTNSVHVRLNYGIYWDEEDCLEDIDYRETLRNRAVKSSFTVINNQIFTVSLPNTSHEP